MHVQPRCAKEGRMGSLPELQGVAMNYKKLRDGTCPCCGGHKRHFPYCPKIKPRFLRWLASKLADNRTVDQI